MQTFSRKNQQAGLFQDCSRPVSDDSWCSDAKKHKEIDCSKTFPELFHMNLYKKTIYLGPCVIECCERSLARMCSWVVFRGLAKFRLNSPQFVGGIP